MHNLHPREKPQKKAFLMIQNEFYRANTEEITRNKKTLSLFLRSLRKALKILCKFFSTTSLFIPLILKPNCTAFGHVYNGFITNLIPFSHAVSRASLKLAQNDWNWKQRRFSLSLVKKIACVLHVTRRWIHLLKAQPF